MAATLLLAACSGNSGPRPSITSTTSAPPEISPDGTAAERVVVRIISQNILHGISCPVETNGCELEDRVAVFMKQLADSGCPELVSVQEANNNIVELVAQHLAACGYELVWDDDPGLDRELVLTTLPVLGARRTTLAGRFRTAFLVRLDSSVGVIDFVSTHLASALDNGRCDDATCPPPCVASDDLRTCQARQVVSWATELVVPGGITVLGGDLNVEWYDAPVQAVLAAGYVDSHLEAGRDECQRSTGRSCTAGRDDESMDDLTDPSSRQSWRIDYLFYKAPFARTCEAVGETGLFLPIVPAREHDGGIVYPSDHTAVRLDLECATSEQVQAGADESGFVEAPDPDVDLGTFGEDPDPVTAAAITFAFETFFDGSVDNLALRVAQLEPADGLEEAFVDVFGQAGDLATAARAEVDDITMSGIESATVTFTVLVNEQVVFDQIPGEAIRGDGRWYVSTRTFCDLAALVPGAGELSFC